MITIRQMLQIVKKAKEIREASWSEDFNLNKHKLCYTKTIDQSIYEVFDNIPDLIKFTPTEVEIAKFMIRNAWNETELWLEEMENGNGSKS